MAYTKQTWTDGVSAVNAERLNHIEDGIAGAYTNGVEWEVPLSSFSGADDDERLTNAMAYCAAQSQQGITIVLDEAKTYSFSVKQPLYTGFSIKGSDRAADQDRSGNPTACVVDLNTDGGWFYLTQGNTFSCSFQGLTLNGGRNQRLIDGHPSNVLWTSTFRDITAVNLGNVCGSVATKLLVTACSWDGFWNVNNIQERALVVGGSDCRMNFSQALIDSPGDSGQFADATSLLEFSSLAKTNVANLYVTAEGNHSALYIGDGSSDHLIFTGCTFEGRNENAPSDGRLVVVKGSHSVVTFRDCWLAYAMANPPAGHDGLVEASSGSVLLDGCTYERAAGVAESVPLLYATGGSHLVRNVRTLGFTGKPVVRQSVDGLIDADNSVQVVTG